LEKQGKLQWVPPKYMVGSILMDLIEKSF